MSKKWVKDISKNTDLWSLYDIKGRHYFTDDRSIAGIPELLEVQLNSYNSFLSKDLDKLFNDSFPINDFSSEKVSIFYKWLSIEEPKYDLESCKRKNLNYETSLKIRLEMLNKETWEIKEQDVYMWAIPKMTEDATFIINWIERVIVNQIIRSTGVYFTINEWVYSFKIIPEKWSWFEIDIEKRGIINVKIDKKRKIPISVLLRAYWLETNADILNTFKDQSDTIISNFLSITLEKDKTSNRLDALNVLYKLLRPGDLATDERVEELFNNTFRDKKRFDLWEIARIKMKSKLNIDKDYKEEWSEFLYLEDFIISLKYFFALIEWKEWYELDDIDHLANRRIKSVWEMLVEKIKIGIARMERIAKDRMTIIDLEDASPWTFINSRPIIAILKEFFWSSPLSQFMDQSNPLSEIAHKRRITAMWPGWLTKERASFEVRDVHPTQYWRICPITTPEWPNIWLVLYMASYSKIDKFWFLITPFRSVLHKVKNEEKSLLNRITLNDIIWDNWKLIVKEKTYIWEKEAKEIVKNISAKEIEVRWFLSSDYEYFDAEQEKVLTIAEANNEIDSFWNFKKTRIWVRHKSNPTVSHISEVTHIDVSPKQIMSIETSLIPFVENDDPTRAEMWSNMMKQAVPLVRSESPYVWTWMERIVWDFSSYVIKAEEDGEIIWVDARHISVLYKSWNKKTYELKVFKRSNHDMIIHQKSLVSNGQKIFKWDLLSDWQSIDNWELALWRNLTVAYMPWKWYNFEDAIIISERLVEKDYFTSISIKEYSIDVRETKLGPEQTTDDIPNVSSYKLRDLWADGIIRTWAYVEWWSILVWKISPKGEQELSPEERLLRAIFWDKSKDVKDSSLRLPSWQWGKILDVHVLKRENWDNLSTWVFTQIKVYVASTRKIEVWDKMAWRHWNKWIVSRVVNIEDMPFMEDGTPVDIILNPLWVVSRMNIWQILEVHTWAAAKKLWITIATPILNWLSVENIWDLLEKSWLERDWKVQLFDWETWEAFKERTVVWQKYMLKLHHLVEDKIHARNVWPYSMITQQPLWWKAQNWWQRFWEMEVWALEAYWASNILQEMITIKSDDVAGRTQAYEAIVKNAPIKKPNIPESFNVLLKELQAIWLDVDLLNNEELLKKEKDLSDRYEEIISIEHEVESNMKKELL